MEAARDESTRTRSLTLESELRGIMLERVREERERLASFIDCVERRRDEITLSRVLAMRRSVEKQWATWWLVGKSIESGGGEDSVQGPAMPVVALRSLLRDSACPKEACGHKWVGTEREPCPKCGAPAASIKRGAVRPVAYKVGLRPLDAREARTAESLGQPTAYIKQAVPDKDGIFTVPIIDAIILLRAHGLGVQIHEWKLRAGQADPAYGKPSDPKHWPVGDRCFVVEVAHEVLITRHRQEVLRES